MPARWTRTSEGLRAYPVPPGTQPVIEPTGLLYAIAAAPLDQPGDALEVLVFRRRDTQAVRIEVLPPREISVRLRRAVAQGHRAAHRQGPPAAAVPAGPAGARRRPGG